MSELSTVCLPTDEMVRDALADIRRIENGEKEIEQKLRAYRQRHGDQLWAARRLVWCLLNDVPRPIPVSVFPKMVADRVAAVEARLSAKAEPT